MKNDNRITVEAWLRVNSSRPHTVDEIMAATGYARSTTQKACAHLEKLGKVARIGGGYIYPDIEACLDAWIAA
jgi:hypothetical protein